MFVNLTTRSSAPGIFKNYKASGKLPSLALDFKENRYIQNRVFHSFDDVVTHTASSNATMVDSDGLVKWRPHNLLLYSEQFDNAAWSKQNVTVTGNAAVAPDGTVTADKIVEGATTARHYLRDSFSVVAGKKYTLAVWAKAAGRSFLQSSRDGVVHSFNLASGALGAVQDDGVTSSSIEDAGNGWYLCKVETVATDTTADCDFYIADVDTRAPTYTGDGTSGIYIWGAHLYRSDLGGMAPVPIADRVAGSETYVPTTSAAHYLPRIGHHVYEGGAWVNKGLLLESAARTNLIAYSNEFDDAWWTKGASSVTPNSASWIGGSDAYLMEETATTASHNIASTAISFSTGSIYTLSAYVKKGTGGTAPDWVQLFFGSAAFGATNQANFNLSTGATGNVTGGTSEIQALPDGWYRISYTAAATGTASAPAAFGFTNNSDTLTRAPNYAGATTSDVFVAGIQVEVGSTPSSYIPTSGSTATRAAETLSIAAANLPWPEPVVIGPELVTNGAFDTDSDWTKGANWTISGGVAESNAATGFADIKQGLTLTAGKVYEVFVEIKSRVSGALAVYLGTSGSSNANINYLSNISTVGVHVGHRSFIGSEPQQILIRQQNGFIGTIDNVSVREINPLAVSMQMDGTVTGGTHTVARWYADTNNYITQAVGTSNFTFTQVNATAVDSVTGGSITPGVNVAVNIASRHGSTFINGAVDGVALTANETPTALADLSSTALQLGSTFNGTIAKFRLWSEDIGDTGIEDATS